MAGGLAALEWRPLVAAAAEGAAPPATDALGVESRQAFQELQRITEAFEQETVDLDQALAKFERGLELARQLKSRLKEIENTVENLKAKFSDKA